jgi:hypothetical protein
MQYVGWTACSAGSGSGTVRCREKGNGSGRCGKHAESFSAAPKASRILISLWVSQSEAESLEAAGLGWLDRSPERQLALEARRVAEAESLRRSPFAIRGVADTGTPVFGKYGLQGGVTLEGLTEELRGERFGLSDAFLTSMPGRETVKLTLEFSSLERDEIQLTEKSQHLLQEMLGRTWVGAHIWANPIVDAAGNCVNTVNVSKATSGSLPKYRLTYSGGAWDAVRP